MLTLARKTLAPAASGLPQSAAIRFIFSPKSELTDMEIEELHRAACYAGSTTYQDPTTGFTAFTELAHLKRGVCCGNRCRHCPYGWENTRGAARETDIPSGDKVAVAARLAELKAQAKSEKAKPKQPVMVVDDNNNNNNNIAQQEKKKKTGGRHGGTLTAKNVPYTRSGDGGSTQLLTGERRAKDDVILEAMGTVDELCAVVGVCHEVLLERRLGNNDGDEETARLQEWMLDIMSRLFDIGSHVAKPRASASAVRSDSDDDDESAAEEEEVAFVADGIGGGFDKAHISELEEWIDILTEELPELSSFILPTGPASQFHVARTVCRRAERRLVALSETSCDPNCLKYVNRLSDFLFTAGRFVNFTAGHDEMLYRRPTKGSKQRTRVTRSAEEQKKD